MLQSEKRAIKNEKALLAVVPREATAGLTRAEWLVLLALAAVQFTHIVDFMIIMPLGPELKKQLHLDPQQFSYIVAVYGISASLASLFAARFLDRFDRKSAVLTLYAGFTLAVAAEKDG
ncbi:MAG: MFS transporter [Gemmataceae bacterium]